MRAIVIVLLCAASIAHAQVPPTKAAELTFEKGRELMKDKKYAQACEAFEQSQRLDPQYGTQYNLAGCYVEMGRLAAAWNVYRELSRSDNNAERKQASTDAATALATRVPKLSIKLERTNQQTTLTLDGKDALALVGVETPVDLGKHVLVVTSPGHKTVTREVDVTEEGKTIAVVLQLEIAEERGFEAAPVSKRKRYGQIATIAGAGVAAVGFIFGGVAYAKNNDAKDIIAHPDPELSSDDNVAKANDQVHGARTFGNLSTGFVVVGLAGVAAGVFLWATSSDENATRVTANFDPSSPGLVIAGHF